MPLSNKIPFRALAAVSRAAFPLLSEALGEDFVLVACPSVSVATEHLNDAIDVVIAGIDFDNGRMFDLLRLFKASDHAKRIPFVCLTCLEGELAGAAQEAVDIATRTLGGDGFVDLYRWTKRFGLDQSYEELRNIIDTLVQFRRAQDRYNPRYQVGTLRP